MLFNLRIGDASYQHRHADSPSGADPNVSTDSFDIEIAGVQGTVPVTIFNRAPRIVDTPSQPGPYTAGTEETFDVSGDFTDATRETLTYMSGTVTGPVPTAVTFMGSTVTIGDTATAGTYNIPVTASDGLLDATYTYTVVVNPEPGGTNQAPTVVGTPSTPGSFTAGTAATFDVASDFTDPDGNTLTYAPGTITGPMPGAVMLSGSTVTIDTTATAGTYSIPVVVTDSGTPALSVTHVYQVVVEAVNRAPVVVAEPSTPGPFLAGVEGTFDVSGDFRDPDGDPLGDTLTYSLGTVSPASAAVTLAFDTSVVTVGTGATAGTYTVPVTAEDGDGLMVTHTYMVEVLATPEVSIRAVTTSVAEGTLATFQVVAEPLPSSDLTVMLDVAEGSGDFIAGTAPTQVMVGTGGTGTFTVPTADDRVDEADGRITATVTSGSGYTVGAPSSATVTVTDDDDPEVSITAGATVTEGGDATFTVTTSTAPATSLFVNVSVDDGVGDFISGPAPQMVTIPAGSTSATLMVPTVDDSMNEVDGMITVTLTSGTGYTVAAPPAHRATVTVSDDDTPEVRITAGNSPITEGAAATFAVTASTASASALTVNVSVVDSGSFISGTAPTTVTILAGQTSAVLRVATEDDTTDEPGGTLTATLTASADYVVAAAPGNQAIVVVNDNDGTADPGVTITAVNASVAEGTDATFTVEASSAAPTGGLTVNVSVTESGSFISGTPPQTVMIPDAMTTATLTVSTVGDSIDELDGTITATVTSGTGYMVGMDSSAVVTVTDDDDPVVSIAAGASPVGEGTSALFEVSASTVQASDLVVSVSVDDGTADFIAGPPPTMVTIPSGESSVTLSVPTEEDRIVETDGPITATLTTGSGYTVAMSPDNSAMVTVTDNDVAGITVTPTSGLTTTEAGGTDTFTVVLDTQPTANVVIGVSSSDETEGTVSTDMLTFTASDWNQPQPVTVTGVDDMNDDGTVSYTIELAAATSMDLNYRGVDPADVSVSNADDDGAIESTVTITAGGGVTEGGDATFTVAASPPPTSDLTVNVDVVDNGAFASSTETGARTLMIPMGDTTATLTVSTMDDNIDEADGTITATLTADTGMDYTVGTPSIAQVAVTDDDVAGVTITPTSGLTTTEAGGTATFTVELDSQPAANVVIGVSSSNEDEGMVSTDELTFTDSDWNRQQTVTVTGVDDDVDDGNQTYTIELAAATSADTNYSGVDPADVSVSNTDNDAAPTSITLTVQPNTLGEADGTTDVMVTATLDGGTTVSTDTTVTLSLGGTAVGSGTDYRAATQPITIAAGASTGTATFGISPTDDDVVEGDEGIEISGTAMGGFTGTVNSTTVTLTDNDVADATPPTFSTAVVNGNLLVLTYDEALDTASVPAVGDFTIGGVSGVSVNMVAISGMTVTLTLSSAVTSTDVVTVTYMPGTDRLRDVAGNEAVALSMRSVTNNTPAAAEPSVSITAVNASVTEGTDATFTVTASMMPSSDLTVNVSVTQSGSFISGMAPTMVTITSGTTTATLPVATVDDRIDENNGSVTATVTGGSGYTVGASSSATVTVNDDDVAGITVSQTTGLTTTEAGGTATFTVVLDSEPTANVVIGVRSSDTNEGTVSPTMLTFTNSDWNQPQPVTVTGVDDAVADGDQAYRVELAAATSMDANYNGEDPADVSVTNEDDLTVTITAGTSPVNEGTAATFTVTASAAAPTGGLTVNVSVTDSGNFISGTIPTMVTINVGATTATLTVNTDDDSVDEVGGAITAMVTAGTGYDVGTAASASVAVNDNDGAVEPSVSITAVNTSVTEGTDATFTVTASMMPSSDLTVNVSVTQSGSFISGTAPTMVTITSGTTTATLPVATVDDRIDENNGSITATVTGGSGYTVGASSSATVAVNDDDVAGITVSQTTGLTTTEAGGTATFTVVLDSEPTANVVIGVRSSDTNEGTVSPTMLTFTNSDWNQPQPVTVTGVDDAVADGDQAYRVELAAATSMDANYNGEDPADVSVTNEDDLTVTITAGTSPVNEGTAATFTVTASAAAPTGGLTVNVSVTDSGNFISGTIPTMVMINSGATTATLTVNTDDDSVDEVGGAITAVVTAGTGYDVGTAASASVAVNDNDGAVEPSVSISAVNASVTEGTDATFTVTASMMPSSDLTVNVSVTQSGSFISGTAPTMVTITSGTTTATLPVATVADRIDENNGSVTATVTGGSGYTVGASSSATVTVNDDDTAGITVSQTTGLTTTEAGGTATFTVVLDSEPTANVVIGVSSSDTNEGTVSPTMLTFTNSDWNQPQPVTVTGVDDAVADGDQAYMVELAAATSADTNYNTVDPDDVSVTNEDDDAAGITVSQTTGLTTTEAGGTATFTVVLDSEPTANVVIGVSSSDTNEGTVSPTMLTFTNSDWNQPQPVTVTGVDDAVADGDQAYMVELAAATSADMNYNTVDPDDVSVTNEDDDAAGITVSQTTGLTTTEAGGTAMFTVVLDSEPTASVSIAVSSSDTTEGTVLPTTLMFTDSTWNQPQPVTVTGVDDTLADGDQAYRVELAAATSMDANYNTVDPVDVSVTNEDDLTVTITAGPSPVNEGAAATFTVTASAAAPTGGLTVNVSVTDSGSFISGTAPTMVVDQLGEHKRDADGEHRR